MQLLKPMPTDVRTLEEQLNAKLLAGRFLEAYEEYYSEDAMEPRRARRGLHVGSDYARALAFFGWVETFLGAFPVRSVTARDTSYSEWIVSRRPRAGRQGGTQVVARRWRDGKVVRERFVNRV
ncbi:MAG: hypothetical protein JSW43_13555 [Gemmatimonadota bacterium]|nr:MAG: hypothetical protein JSW43_13555 [Gemmatimonadota bacterium]